MGKFVSCLPRGIHCNVSSGEEKFSTRQHLTVDNFLSLGYICDVESTGQWQILHVLRWRLQIPRRHDRAHPAPAPCPIRPLLRPDTEETAFRLHHVPQGSRAMLNANVVHFISEVTIELQGISIPALANLGLFINKSKKTFTCAPSWKICRCCFVYTNHL